MFHFIGFLIIGLVAGLLARAIMPGRQSMSTLMTMVLGVVGALAAGWFGRAVGWYGPEDGAGFIASIVGAVVVLAIYVAVTRRRGATSLTSDRDFPRKAA